MKTLALDICAKITSKAILLFAQLVTAVRGIWSGIDPVDVQRIYFANHASHGDFVLIWTVLPSRLRKNTRPVAGADYWLKGKLRSFIGRSVFNAVLIDRNPETRQADPVAQMTAALDEGCSLILFPEGTRNTTDVKLLPFKSGLYHLALSRPDVELIPVWIDNLNRVMPKGEVIPIPLICSVTFGEPVFLQSGEEKDAFLQRSFDALNKIAPASQDQLVQPLSDATGDDR